MPDKEDKPSFMSRLFPEVTPLRQNKQENKSTNNQKPFLRPKSAHENVDTPALRLSGDASIGAADELNFQGNGVQNRVMRDLKRGKIAVVDQLDLHGQTVEQAHQSCMEFIYYCQQKKQNCVLIIHGQGYRSSGGVPVLKQQVDYWLRQHPAVLAFCSALQRDGGKGSLYVLLRKDRQSATE